MKTKLVFHIGLVLFIGIGLIQFTKAEASTNNDVSFQVFYNELTPFGDWVMDPQHGYIWIPRVNPGFHPYSTNGYWTMTEFGNTWVSNYDWGWAPFHYGRWYFDNFYGWAWVPGYEWGPAWVSWRSGRGHYGWAPLLPGIGINLSINIPFNHWVFLPQRRFRHRYFHQYYVPAYQVVNIYNHTTVIQNTYINNNRTYIKGPERREIERVTRRSVPVYRVSDSSRPGRSTLNNNRLAVYRPEITPNRSGQNEAKPSRSYTLEEYKANSADRSSTRNGVEATRSRQIGNTPNQTRTRISSENPSSTQREVTQRNNSSQENYRMGQNPNSIRNQMISPTQTRSNTEGSSATNNRRVNPNYNNSSNSPGIRQQSNVVQKPASISRERSVQTPPSPRINNTPARRSNSNPSAQVQRSARQNEVGSSRNTGMSRNTPTTRSVTTTQPTRTTRIR